jgi:hypothetical protein
VVRRWSRGGGGGGRRRGRRRKEEEEGGGGRRRRGGRGHGPRSGDHMVCRGAANPGHGGVVGAANGGGRGQVRAVPHPLLAPQPPLLHAPGPPPLLCHHALKRPQSRCSDRREERKRGEEEREEQEAACCGTGGRGSTVWEREVTRALRRQLTRRPSAVRGGGGRWVGKAEGAWWMLAGRCSATAAATSTCPTCCWRPWSCLKRLASRSAPRTSSLAPPQCNISGHVRV